MFVDGRMFSYSYASMCPPAVAQLYAPEPVVRSAARPSTMDSANIPGPISDSAVDPAVELPALACGTSTDLSASDGSPSDAPADGGTPAGRPFRSASPQHGASVSPVGARARTSGPPPPPNNCIVLKNLPYSISPVDLENLVREITGSRKAFVNVSLVVDKTTGSFRGMAFVNFHNVGDATSALPGLTALQVDSRKVFAEYRRLRPGEKERREAREKASATAGGPGSGFVSQHNKQQSQHLQNERNHVLHNPRRATFEMEIAPELDEDGNEKDKRASFFAMRDTAKRADDRLRANEKAEREKDLEADFRNQLVTYRGASVPEGEEIQDVCFDQDLSSFERRIVHVLCDELGLGHVSRSMNDGSRVLFVTKDPDRIAAWQIETEGARAVAAEKAIEKAALAEEKRKKHREAQQKARTEAEASAMSSSNLVSNGAPTREELEGIKWFRPRSAMQHGDGSGAGEDSTGGEGGDNINSAVRGIEKPTYKVYIPARQPKGPDNSIGFTRRNVNPVSQEVERPTVVENDETRETSKSFDVGTPEAPIVRKKPVLNPTVPEFVFPSV
jgi:RNA recognition motif-containing protein